MAGRPFRHHLAELPGKSPVSPDYSTPLQRQSVLPLMVGLRCDCPIPLRLLR